MSAERSAAPMRRVVSVVIALGANLGDRGSTLESACRELSEHPLITRVRMSRVRESIAVTVHGPDPEAPRYFNAVVTAETALSAHDLLDVLQRIESQHGRQRTVRWGDRTLDLDIIVYGGRVIQDDRLTVPHPRAHERDFVLSPWLDLEPHAALIGQGRVRDLLQRVGDTTQLCDGSRPEHTGTVPE